MNEPYRKLHTLRQRVSQPRNRHLNIALSALQMAARQETLSFADKFTVEFLRDVTADSIKHIADIRNKSGIYETGKY